jgi:benzoylformate decarboxylase
MANSERPVVAIAGDSSATYQPQALWTAVRYCVGVFVVVLVNRRYATLDQITEASGETSP